MITVKEAKKIINIFSVWELLNLPGSPGKSCKAPHREDRSPSFSIYDNGNRFKDFGTGENGDVVVFISLVLGISESEACKELIKFAGGGNIPPVSKTCISSNQKTEEEDQNFCEYLRLGSQYELYKLAELRGIGFHGIRLAQKRGHLRFLSNKAGTIWSLADLDGAFRQDRLLSGNPIRLKDGKRVKARTLGKLKHPLGLTEAHPYESILLVEGGPDFLAAHYLITQTKQENLFGVIAMLGANQEFTPEQAKNLKGKRVRIFPHMDEAGMKGVQNWFSSLKSVGVHVDIYDYDEITTKDGKLITDLNDLLRVNLEDWDNDPLITNPLRGLYGKE